MADNRGRGRGDFRGGQRGGGSGAPQGRGGFQARGRGDFQPRGGGGFQGRGRGGGDVRGGGGGDFRGRGRGGGGEFRGRGGGGEFIGRGGFEPRGGRGSDSQWGGGGGGRGRGLAGPTIAPTTELVMEDFPAMPGTVVAEAAPVPQISPAPSVAASAGEPHQQEGGGGKKKKKKGKKGGAGGGSQDPTGGQEEPIPGPSTGPTEQGKSAQQKKKKKGGPIDIVPEFRSLKLDSKMLPPRPDRGGTLGSKIRVGVNCWDFSIRDLAVILYDIEPTKAFRQVKGEPDKDLNAKPKMLRELLQDVINRLPACTFYDGGRQIFSLDPLPGTSTAGTTRREQIADPLGRDQLAIEYIIKEVSRVSATAILDYVKDPLATTRNIPQVAINMVDNLLRWVNSATFKNFGRSAMFHPQPRQEKLEKLFVIHSGFMISVRPQWKVRMNIDMVHRAFFPTGELSDILYHKYGDDMYQSRNWQAMARDIRMIRVEANYYKTPEGIPYKRRFTAQGLSDLSAAMEKIPDKEISIAQYFKDTYGITLKYPELPCVKTKKDKKEYIPMELLNVLPYQNPNADKGDIASAVIKCAAVRPQDRFRELDNFVTNFMRNQHELLRRFDLRILNRQPVTVEARELPQPRGQFRGQQPSLLGRGKWNPLAYFEPAQGDLKWAIYAIPPNNSAQRNLAKAREELTLSARRVGVNLAPNPTTSATCVARDLPRIFDNCANQGVKLIMFILGGNFEYSEIKRLGDLQKGMVTQCVKSQTVFKPNVFPNLLLKINGKLGGMNWLVNDLKLSDELIMVMGADVTHPGPTGGQDMRKSVAAVIGSITPDLMKYAAIVRQQDTTASVKDKATREVIDSMDTILYDLLDTFRNRNNGRLPTKIIFYRDGVSEGQFETVLQSELCDIQRACRRIQGNYEPGITFIVVQKRHHIRLNPTDPRMRNVNPGTVVDTQITHPREFDFYLCSQEGIQGTSKPAHYHVLYDDNNWTSDALQRFTYFLCHAYMRCCRSVSYPAPTFYSHLAAFRARDWLKGATRPADLLTENRFRINAAQSSRMFFL